MFRFLILTLFVAMPVSRAALRKLNNTASAVPALQPADVFDSDYPVDMAGLTPQELRYRAQADYAKAVAALKREAAEAEAARIAMKQQLGQRRRQRKPRRMPHVFVQLLGRNKERQMLRSRTRQELREPCPMKKLSLLLPRRRTRMQ